MKKENEKENAVIYTIEDLMEIFPFKRSKLLMLCKKKLLPVVKVGKTYISSPELINRWMMENEGKEILYNEKD